MFKISINKYLIAPSVAVAALVLGANPAMAETANATVTIVTPITVTRVTDLKFGQLYSVAGTSIVTTAGTQNGGTASFAGTQTVSAALFNIAGQDNFAYTPQITVTPAAPAVAGLAISAMLGRCGVEADVALAAATAVNIAGCALSSGTSTVAVGGTLTVTAAAVAGTHIVGGIVVTAAYN
jgi:hypothetical protein